MAANAITPELLHDEPDSYDMLLDDFHDQLAIRVGAALERLRALETELVKIQIDLESRPK